MKLARSLLQTIFRFGYYVAMYSGLRACVNRARQIHCTLDPGILKLHGHRLRDAVLGQIEIHAHPRRGSPCARSAGNHGMFCVRQIAPAVNRVAYGLMCSTSHFGCGHIEVAFFENDGAITLYGVRNIASANASRIGLAALARRLRLSPTEDPRVLRVLTTILRARGYSVTFASARDCIELTIDDRLLPAATRQSVRERLFSKYARLGTELAGTST